MRSVTIQRYVFFTSKCSYFEHCGPFCRINVIFFSRQSTVLENLVSKQPASQHSMLIKGQMLFSNTGTPGPDAILDVSTAVYA